MLTRREITLLLFGFTVFIVAYNFESSVRRFSPAALLTRTSASALLGVEHVFREDGRRLEKYADDFEQRILGDWEVKPRPVFELGPHVLSEEQQQKSWRQGDIPVTELIAHVPGYTIFDNVLLSNGSMFLVSDHVSHGFPRSDGMISTGLPSPHPPVLQDIAFITRHQVIETLGYSAHRFPGASIICLDHPAVVDNHTFISLHRAYSALDVDSAPQPPPDRTWFANTKRTSLDETGYDLKLARAVFPFMAHLYGEDWDDFERTRRPVFFDRVVLVDRIAASHGTQVFDFSSVEVHLAERTNDSPALSSISKAKSKSLAKREAVTISATDKRLALAPPFALPAPTDWFVRVRQRMLEAFALEGADTSKSLRRAVTYVSVQWRRNGPRLSDEDHMLLVAELRRLGRTNGWDVHVVELRDSQTEWPEHMKAALQSSVMLGVYGDTLVNSVLMRPHSPTPTVIEFFPDGRYTNEQEFISRSLGFDYVAWRNTKKYMRDSLPPISPPTSADTQTLNIDVKAVVQFVKDQLKRT